MKPRKPRLTLTLDKLWRSPKGELVADGEVTHGHGEMVVEQDTVEALSEFIRQSADKYPGVPQTPYERESRYLRQNGAARLTAKQQKRLRQKANRFQNNTRI